MRPNEGLCNVSAICSVAERQLNVDSLELHYCSLSLPALLSAISYQPRTITSSGR